MTALLDTVLATIRERRDEIEARYGIRLLGVVGSVARGEERPDSDVDIAYKVVGYSTLFRIAAAQGELEDALGRKVDVVNISNTRPEARAWFERELAPA